jgi:hypothetical protein
VVSSWKGPILPPLAMEWYRRSQRENLGLDAARPIGKTRSQTTCGLKPGSKTSPNVLSRKARPCAGPLADDYANERFRPSKAAEEGQPVVQQQQQMQPKKGDL